MEATLSSTGAARPFLARLLGDRHILLEKNMQWYYGTQTISLTGLMLRSSLMSLLMIDLVGIKSAPPLVGIVLALNLLPGTFLAVPAGIIVDRFDKRTVLKVTAIVSIVQALWLALFSLFECRQIIESHRFISPHDPLIFCIMALALVGGFANGIDGICRNVIVKDALLVHKDERIDRRNQKLSGNMFTFLYNLAIPVGNGVSGFMVHTVGYAWSFVAIAGTFVILIVGLSKLDFTHHTHTKEEWRGMWTTIRENVRYTFTTRGIRFCILQSATITIFAYSYNVILAIIAKTMFANGPHMGGPQDYSYLAVFAGLGSLVGAIVTLLYGGRKPKAFVIAGCLICGVGQIALASMHNIDRGALMVFICGLGFMPAFMPFRGVMQHLVDRGRMGVVFGIMFTFFYGGMMVSSIGSGYLAKHIGCPTTLVLFGGILILTGLLTPILPGNEELK